MQEGTFVQFLKMEQNKYGKVLMKNPQWQRLLMALYATAMAYANQKKCSLMDIESNGTIRDFKFMHFDIKHEVKKIGTGIIDENGEEVMREVTPENPIPIDYKGHKTYTIEDMMNTEIKKLTLMCPPLTKQWMGLLERIVFVKGLTAAENCRFEGPLKDGENKYKVIIRYGV